MSGKKRILPQRRCNKNKKQIAFSSESCEVSEYDDTVDVVMLPYPESSDSESENESNNSEDVSDEDNDDENEDNADENDDADDENDVQEIVEKLLSYHEVKKSYSNTQKRLQEYHVYDWTDGEKKYDEIPYNKYLLKDKDRKMIANSTPVELFEMFFCKNIKEYIIEASKFNGLDITIEELNKFVAIIILSAFNKRTSEKDYWSKNELLESPVVRSLMSLKKFLKIKSKIKCSKPTDKNKKDRAWRVRAILEIFRKNIKQFGFFQIGLSIDEMMIKFFEFGICGADGYLFNCDIYCGKGTHNNELSSIALGSQAVLSMSEALLSSISRKKIEEYHLWFDNYYTNPDLLVHLKKLGLRATGVIRKDRIPVKNEIDKKAPRGTFKVQYEKNSGMNFVTVVDSKQVSIISTTARVTPTKEVKRYSKEKKMITDISMPLVFSLYNLFMGGVDLHDQYCSALLPIIRSKRWTWLILMRIIQSSIANAVILYNACSGKKKVSAKKFALSIVDSYVKNAKLGDLKNHNLRLTIRRRACNEQGCATRTFYMCKECKKYYCSQCFANLHK
ncbi:piggyBac transposable element-derived protein 3-like [Phymastichus coffea]|uniref:piggyBac transposable element-derived protein 3-like n=1 Tax=Phymastichus coffea TaxID=108790 RepID=UPI00273BD524|nr:piggyBac transposable element-derived protein 3-like [Phymastichus coffea]